MKKKIYIAGKVSGLPIAETTLKFGAAQKELEVKGFEAINPLAVVNDWKATWEDAMKKCIAALVTADAVYLLPCCDNSPGAKWEIAIAATLKIPAFQKVDELYQLIIGYDGCFQCGSSEEECNLVAPNLCSNCIENSPLSK